MTYEGMIYDWSMLLFSSASSSSSSGVCIIRLWENPIPRRKGKHFNKAPISTVWGETIKYVHFAHNEKILKQLVIAGARKNQNLLQFCGTKCDLKKNMLSHYQEKNKFLKMITKRWIKRKINTKFVKKIWIFSKQIVQRNIIVE